MPPRRRQLLSLSVVSLTSALLPASSIGVAHARQVDSRLDYPLAAQQSREPWITSQGTKFIDSRTNKPVLLHGVNVMLGPPAVYEGVAAMHVNLVRLVITWSRIEPSAPVNAVHEWNKPDLLNLDAEVAWFERHQINVVLDFHQDWWSSFFHDPGDGVPAWYYAGGPFDRAQVSQAEAAFWTTDASRSVSRTQRSQP